MRQSRITIILLSCFFSLIVGSRSSIFAQQPPQTPEKERGIELYRKGNFSEAVVALQEAVKNQERDPDAWYYLGLSLRAAGKIKEAREVLAKTLSLRSNFAPGYTEMAYVCLLDNDYKGAVGNAEKSLALDPKSFESHCIAGWARLRDSAAADALAKAEEALKIKSDYPEAMILKTQALIGMFIQGRVKMNRGSESRRTGNQPDDLAKEEKSQNIFFFLKQAAESLEAYLKLKPEQSERALWDEQLEALRVYARLGTEPSSATLRKKPKILYREKAEYTDAGRKAGIQGSVILMAVLAEDGVIKHILVLQPLSHGLTEQAIMAARKILFTPAFEDGRPVSTMITLEFTFNPY
jgi:tetratricopeptide (TPR) repeat protein